MLETIDYRSATATIYHPRTVEYIRTLDLLCCRYLLGIWSYLDTTYHTFYDTSEFYQYHSTILEYQDTADADTAHTAYQGVLCHWQIDKMQV